MPTRIEVYSHSGILIAELTGAVSTTAWKLNGIGQAKISIAKTDSAVTEDFLQFGNRIRIRNDVAGDWGGELAPPRDWYASSLTLTAFSAEYRLKRRSPIAASYTGTAGEIFTAMIADANIPADTGIDLYTANSSGGAWTEQGDNDLYSIMARIRARSGQDWGFFPVLNASNRLRFNAYWYTHRGTDWNFALEEGWNIKDMEGSILLSEQGEIVNDLTLRAYSTGNSEDVNVVDLASQATYGLNQDFRTLRVPDGLDRSAYAALLLGQSSQPRRTYYLIALNVGGTFDYLGLGDSVELKLRRYGFTGNELGTTTRVRVLAKEYSEQSGEMRLIVDEVTA